MIDIGFIFFRTLGLEHLDAAWYTLSRQDFTDVSRVYFLDNNTAFDWRDIELVLQRYKLPVPYTAAYHKHGDNTKTQSWSVNEMGRTGIEPWLFLTRADFLLDDDCLSKFRAERDRRGDDWRGFVTSYCHQCGYDDQLSNTDALAPYSLPDAAWRTDPRGAKSLFGTVPAVHFTNTHLDAGVWLIKRELMAEAGGLNEKMISWGYQQQAFQRALVRIGTEIVQVPEFLFHHQHHWAPRDFAQAAAEAPLEHS